MSCVEEVGELANVELFLSEMNSETTSKMCHQASIWLAVQIKKNYLSDYNIHICTGTYEGLDHSWLLVEDADSGVEHVVDMTLNQFIDCEVPFVGQMDNSYRIHYSICLCDDSDKIKEFVESLGL
jgi:hypothetical protein